MYLEEERSFGGSLDDVRQRMAYYEEVLDRELAATAPLGTDEIESADVGAAFVDLAAG